MIEKATWGLAKIGDIHYLTTHGEGENEIPEWLFEELIKYIKEVNEHLGLAEIEIHE